MRRSRSAMTDPDLARVLAALKRAAAAAWRLAVETGTPFYVIENGRVVDRNAGRKKLTATRVRGSGRPRVGRKPEIRVRLDSSGSHERIVPDPGGDRWGRDRTLMRTVELEKATEPLAEYARRASTEGVVVTLRGKPVATLAAVPAGADWESLAIGTHPKFLEIMERSRAAHRQQGGVSPDEMRRRLGLRKKPRRRKRRVTP